MISIITIIILSLISFITTKNVVLTGSGSSVPFPVYSEWIYQYSLLRPEIAISYESTSSGRSVSAITAAGTKDAIDFGQTDAAMTDAQFNVIIPKNDVLQVPAVATATVLIYNIPGLLMTSSDPIYNLRLDRLTMALIFNQNITNWRDERILALQNPNVSALLPNATLNLVVRSDSAGTTKILQEAMKSFYSGWKWGASNTWPSAYIANSRVYTVSQSARVGGYILAVDNSIGYVTYSAIATNQVGIYKYASLQNKNGDWLTGVPDLSPSINNATFDSNFAAVLYDSPVPLAWPLGGISYLILRKTNYSLTAGDCNSQRELYLFFNWVMSSKIAYDRVIFQGYNFLGTKVSKLIIAEFNKLTCNGLQILRPIALPQHDASLGSSIVAAATVLAACMIMLVSYFQYCHPGSAMSVFFNIFVLTGCTMCYMANIAYTMIPTDQVCQSRVWLTAVGFAMLYGGMFARSFQFYWAYQASKNPNNDINLPLIIGQTLVVILGIQLLLLGIWQAVDPYHAVHVKIDDLRLTHELECDSVNFTMWTGLEISYFLGLLNFGIYILVQSWEVRNLFTDSRYIMVLAYNTIVVLAILLTLCLNIDFSDDGVTVVASFANLLLTTSSMLTLFLPKMIRTISTGRASVTGEFGNESVGSIASASNENDQPKTPIAGVTK